jgi:alanine racemase
VWAEIDLSAVRHNASLLRRLAHPAVLCAVVKADAYGHGALPVARAVLEGGATWLAVATVEEGVALREGGIDAHVLLLSEPAADAMDEVVAFGLIPTVYTEGGVAAVSAAARRRNRIVDVHLKVDTGMHRVGVDVRDVPEVARSIDAGQNIRLGGLWTHFAVADSLADDDRAFTDEQLHRFGDVRAALAAGGIVPAVVHSANSAATIALPSARLDLVRCGITVYGEPPAPAFGPLFAEVSGDHLRPVLSLRARVGFVRALTAGERPSYGRRYALATDSRIATVPLGYADGVPRRYFSEGGTVLVGGRRRPVAGTVTMDHIMVDCGPDADVAVGDEVVLIGSQGGEVLTAGDWADVLGTISYEVLCGIGPRVPRVTIDGALREPPVEGATGMRRPS